MIIQTKYHGELEFKQEKLWAFPSGIPGFQEETAFALYPLEGQDVFWVLQSVRRREVAFVVVNPFSFFPDYDFSLEVADIEALELANAADALTLAILTLGDSLAGSTANLKAPLILNTTNRKGRQVILHGTDYRTRHEWKLKAEKG
ncbi:MAG: flagellar assembly protein FliW [Bacillus sp. (in: firmicutes)]